MRRIRHLIQVLSDFQRTYPELPSLTLETGWNHAWTEAELMQFRSWRWETGIYFFVDFCSETDCRQPAADERFSVIRRIGKAETTFARRHYEYGHKLKGKAGPRMASDHKNGWPEWFRYSQIDFIRIQKTLAYRLESFLLERIRTEWNDKDVPDDLRRKPTIYDEQSE